MVMKTLTAFGLATLLATGCAFAQASPTATTPSATTPPPAATTTATKPLKEHKSKKTDATDTASAPTGTPAAVAATPTAATAKTAKPAATTAGTSLPGTKVNVNTATAEQLDALPEVGQARSKVIVTERAKGPFKDWADFDTRTAHTSLNAGVKSKIKDHVTF